MEFQQALKKATIESRVNHTIDEQRHVEMALDSFFSHAPPPPPGDKPRDAPDEGELAFDA